MADIALDAHWHVGPDAGIDVSPSRAVGDWIELVEAQPGFVDGPRPYPPSATARDVDRRICLGSPTGSADGRGLEKSFGRLVATEVSVYPPETA